MLDNQATATAEPRLMSALDLRVLEAVVRLPDDAVQGVLELLEDAAGKTDDANADLAKVFMEWFANHAALVIRADLSDDELTRCCQRLAVLQDAAAGSPVVGVRDVWRKIVMALSHLETGDEPEARLLREAEEVLGLTVPTT